MPAFMFEKIPSPIGTGSPLPQASSRKSAVGKSRRLVHSMLDRLAVARLKREQAKVAPTVPLKPPPE